MGVLDTYQTMINIVNYEKMEGLFRVNAHCVHILLGLDGDEASGVLLHLLRLCLYYLKDDI